MYVCMYACMYVCTACIHMRTYECMNVLCLLAYTVCMLYMFVCMYVCMYVLHMYVCMYVCMHLSTGIYTFMYVCMHVCMYVNECASYEQDVFPEWSESDLHLLHTYIIIPQKLDGSLIRMREAMVDVSTTTAFENLQISKTRDMTNARFIYVTLLTLSFLYSQNKMLSLPERYVLSQLYVCMYVFMYLRTV